MRAIILLSILGLAATTPIDTNNVEQTVLDSHLPRNSVLENQLLNLLEDFRQTMLTGSDTVPVLDPFQFDFIAVDDTLVPLPGLKVEVGKTTVTQMSNFVVDDLTLVRTTLFPLRYRLEVDGQIPVIEIESEHYDLSVPVAGFLIFGTGDAKLKIIEPRITGHVIVRPSIGLFSLYIRLEDCQLRFALKGFEPQINGLLGGSEGLVAFVNTFLSHLVPDLVTLYEDEISEVLSAAVLQIGNEVLSDFNLIGIIGSV